MRRIAQPAQGPSAPAAIGSMPGTVHTAACTPTAFPAKRLLTALCRSCTPTSFPRMGSTTGWACPTPLRTCCGQSPANSYLTGAMRQQSLLGCLHMGTSSWPDWQHKVALITRLFTILCPAGKGMRMFWSGCCFSMHMTSLLMHTLMATRWAPPFS